jgi:hypothetical protein
MDQKTLNMIKQSALYQALQQRHLAEKQAMDKEAFTAALLQRLGGWMANKAPTTGWLGSKFDDARRSAAFLKGDPTGIAGRNAMIAKTPGHAERGNALIARHQGRLQNLGMIGAGAGLAGAGALGYGAYRMLRKDPEQEKQKQMMMQRQMMMRGMA